MSTWICAKCTLINNANDDYCLVCNALRSMTLQQQTISCPVCTYANLEKASRCEICDSILKADFQTAHPHPKDSQLANDTRQSLSTTENDDDLFDIIKNNSSFYFEKIDSKGKFLFRCLFDDKVCSTENIMIAYIIKAHKPAVKQFLYKPKSDEPSSRNSIQGDLELAFQIAFDEYDEQSTTPTLKRNNRSTQSKSP